MLSIILLAALVVSSYFAWTAIHEYSHLLMAKKKVGVPKYEMKLYPHIGPGEGPWWKRIRFGSVKYWLTREPTPSEDYQISIAPRYADLVAVVMFPLTACLSGPFAWVWAIFWGAGLVDLIYGSIGYSPYSDLRKAAESQDINPWVLRGLGFGAAAISLAVYILLRF